MRHNPIFRLLIPHRTWPATLAAVALFALMTAASILWNPPAFQGHNPTPAIRFIQTVALSSTAVIVITGALCSILAALSSGHLVRSESYAVILLTRLSNRTIAAGHLLAALFRTRILWAACLALLVLLWISFVREDRFFECINRYFQNPCNPRTPISQSIFEAGEYVIALGTFGLGFNLLMLCTTLGVVLKTRSIAASLSVGTAVCIAGIVLLYVVVRQALIGLSWLFTLQVWLALIGGCMLVVGIGIYALTARAR